MDIRPEQMALLIPILAITLLCTLAIITVVLKYFRRRHVMALYHEERMAAINKGVEVPTLPEALLLDGASGHRGNPRRALLRGLIWLFVSIGLYFALGQENRREAVFAIIPFGVGLAYLIYYFVEGRKPVAELPSDPEPPSSMPVSATPPA